MPTSTLLARQPVAHFPALTVYLLHTWDSHHDETELYFRYEDALHALATRVRRDWANHLAPGRPVTPSHLSDAAAICAFYGIDLTERPAAGEFAGAGFDITEETVYGLAPDLVPPHAVALHLVDEQPDREATPVSYRIDALGLRIAVTAGTDGPAVAISNAGLSPGTAVTVTTEHFEEQAA